MMRFPWLELAVAALLLTGCVTAPTQAHEWVLASWYGPGFHGRTTANGETYNQYATSPYTAAHKVLPFGTRVRVSYNGTRLVVCINDRGPFIGARALDLNQAAARDLGLLGPGVDWVEMEVLDRPSSGCRQ